jgi:hypothetical protein
MTNKAIHPKTFEKMAQLPNHLGLCQEILSYFYDLEGIDGAFISGSGVSGGMDKYSDLDLGFLCASVEAKERIWNQRWNWSLPKWFHRMDADHIKPHFVIYLFEPHIHVDLSFYTMTDLPTQFGAPFAIAFDKQNQLGDWLAKANKPLTFPPDWSNVIHEEERFWTWTHYLWQHTSRGEYFDDATFLGIMRGLLQTWHSRLKGSEVFSSRRLENKDPEFARDMKELFPSADRQSLKMAYLKMIEIHNKQRAQIDALIKPKWTTTQEAREKITKLICEI